MAMAAGKTALMSTEATLISEISDDEKIYTDMSCSFPKHLFNDDISDISNRILCPFEGTVRLADKPNILGASKSTLALLFRIPEYLILDPETSSLVQAQAFAERVGKNS
jgi:hypothetical protein